MSPIDGKAVYDSFAEQSPALIVRAHMMLFSGRSVDWIVSKLKEQMAAARKWEPGYEEGLLQFRIAVEYLSDHQVEIGLEQLLKK